MRGSAGAGEKVPDRATDGGCGRREGVEEEAILRFSQGRPEAKLVDALCHTEYHHYCVWHHSQKISIACCSRASYNECRPHTSSTMMCETPARVSSDVRRRKRMPVVQKVSRVEAPTRDSSLI